MRRFLFRRSANVLRTMDDTSARPCPPGVAPSDSTVVTDGGFATELKLLVTALEVNCVIGVYPGERDRAQRLCIDLELGAQPPAAFDDDFSKVVDYGTTVERVKQVCAENHAHLLETLGDQILAACFEDRRVFSASVRIRKLDLDRAAKGIGIALTRRRLQAS